MKIKIVSPVNKNYQDVFEGFNAKLFEYLAPKGQLKLLRFDGCNKDDVIEIEFLKPMKAFWRSEITEAGQTKDRFYFIDEGKILPYGLTKWTHQHIIKKTGSHTCEVIDEIHYSGKNSLLTILHFIPLYISFYQRKAKYKRFFT